MVAKIGKGTCFPFNVRPSDRTHLKHSNDIRGDISPRNNKPGMSRVWGGDVYAG